MSRPIKFLAKFTFVFSVIFLPAAFAAEERVVRWVIDGDTFELEGGERVRLIGVDAPENMRRKNHVDFYGPESAALAKALLNGQKVRLEKDIQEKDKYGRTLAYAYLEDGTFVNARLVEEGAARAIVIAPNGRHYSHLKSAQQKARKLQKGLWAKR